MSSLARLDNTVDSDTEYVSAGKWQVLPEWKEVVCVGNLRTVNNGELESILRKDVKLIGMSDDAYLIGYGDPPFFATVELQELKIRDEMYRTGLAKSRRDRKRAQVLVMFGLLVVLVQRYWPWRLLELLIIGPVLFVLIGPRWTSVAETR